MSSMMKNLNDRHHLHVLITGSSGSGTTTLGRAVAQQLQIPFFDADDYFWAQASPPFTTKRDPVARLNLFLDDLRKTPSAIIAGSIMNWGAELENGFSLIVFLTLNSEMRVARLRERELALFGQVNPKFLEWAAQYDEGHLPGRSLNRHEQWLRKRSCSVLRLDGDLSIAERSAHVLEALFPDKTSAPAER